MNLHLDRNAFNAAIQASSKKLNILPVFVEKDYWITLVLKHLSESKYNENVVFKGGTSLSKGYKLINRFFGRHRYCHNPCSRNDRKQNQNTHP